MGSWSWIWNCSASCSKRMRASDPIRKVVAAPSLPHWFWFLPLLAIVLWWPIDAFWASDDFFALHYAQDRAHALADFTGWQYGAEDLWFFWRPLITLSFHLDVLLAGGNPFWAHLENVLAHGACVLLAGLLWRRVLSNGLAFAAALLWSIMPGHTGTIAWAVGRVDGHTTVWILLSLLMFVRWCEGKDRTRAFSLIAMLLALASKELAFAVAPLCTVIGFAIRRSWLAAFPHWLLLGAVIAFRIGVLGRFGGYLETAFDPLPMAYGYLDYIGNVLNPWRWHNLAVTESTIGAAADALRWLGFLPALIALWFCLRRKSAPLVALSLCLFAIASVPIAGFFASSENPHNLRYFYLASLALTGLLVAFGRVAVVIAFAAFAPAFMLARLDQHYADAESAEMHRKLVRQTDGQQGLWFAAGLPHSNNIGNVVQMHFGIDRMLRPPFADGQAKLYAHRPLLNEWNALSLHDQSDQPIAVPGAHTVLFRSADLLVTVPELPMQELPIKAEWRTTAQNSSQPGPWLDVTATGLDLSSARMQQLKDGGDKAVGSGIEARLVTPSIRPAAYRVTIFTANGYLCSVVPADASSEGTDGTIDLLRFFRDTQCVPLGYLLRLLEVPTIVDLTPSFPVLIEAGRIRNDQFVPTHRARTLPVMHFDRGYPAVVRRMLGIDR